MLNSKENAVLIPIIKDLEIDFSSVAIVPILALGDTYGAIVIIGNHVFSSFDIKVLQTFVL